MAAVVFAQCDVVEEDAGGAQYPGGPIHKTGFRYGIQPPHIAKDAEDEGAQEEGRGERVSIMMLHALSMGLYGLETKVALWTALFISATGSLHILPLWRL